jgi:outer membrane protein assembly factor BamB
MLVEAIEDGDYLLCEYGPDFSGGRYLGAFNPTSGRADFIFDFGSYIMPPEFVEADQDYIEERLNWATLDGGMLYVSNGHRTYAKSSHGLNAYITALEQKTGKLIWRSKPLVSNSSNFAIYKDAILTGYGFTAEPDFLYVLSKSSGRIVQTVKLRSGPDYIVVRGDQVFVRTYNVNYVFRITD